MLREALGSAFEIEAVVGKEGVEVDQWKDIPEELRFEVNAADFARLSTQVNGEGVLTVLRFPGSALRQRVSVVELRRCIVRLRL